MESQVLFMQISLGRSRIHLSELVSLVWIYPRPFDRCLFHCLGVPPQAVMGQDIPVGSSVPTEG